MGCKGVEPPTGRSGRRSQAQTTTTTASGGAFPHLLRPAGPTGRGAGANHREPEIPDPTTLQRQCRTNRAKGQKHPAARQTRNSVKGKTPGSNSVVPEPDSVFPGKFTRQSSEPEKIRQVPESFTAQTAQGECRYSKRAAHAVNGLKRPTMRILATLLLSISLPGTHLQAP